MKKTLKISSLFLCLALLINISAVFASALPDNFLGGVRYDDINWKRSELSTNILGTAKYFNGFFFENFENVIDTEGALAVGGNFVNGHSGGYSVSGMHPQAESPSAAYSQFDARMIVNGNITGTGSSFNIMGGHIVTSASSTVGNFNNGSTVMLKAINNAADITEINKIKGYYNTNSTKMFSFTGGPSEGSNQYTIFSKDTLRMTDQQIYGDSTKVSKFFSDAKTDLKARSVELFGKAQTSGVSIDVSWHTFNITCVSNAVNIINLDLSTAAAGSYLAKIGQSNPMDITLDGGINFLNLGSGTAILNLKVQDGAKITGKWASWGVDGNNKQLFGQVLINIPNAMSLYHVSMEMCTSFLAPETIIYPISAGGNIYGTVVAKSLKSQNTGGFELHNFGLKNCSVPGLSVPEDEPETPTSGVKALGWMRSSELQGAKYLLPVGGKDWTYNQVFNNTPIKYFQDTNVQSVANAKAALYEENATPAGEQLVGMQHIWDKGTYFDKYKIQNGNAPYSWASWKHWGESGNTSEKGQYSIRRFAAYFSLTAAEINGMTNCLLAPQDELGNMSYLFPINDNVFVFVNGELAYWGGTDVKAGNNQFGALNRTTFMGKTGVKVRNGVNDVFKDIYPHTDGWCIDLNENASAVNIKAYLKAGFNRVDIITDEYWEGGGMNELLLYFD